MSESSSSSGFPYRAFISYSHADKAWADWLHKALETYRVPSRLVGTTTAHGTILRRLNPVFRDRDELSSSPELGTRINQALAQSENLIVICSPASAASRWVNEEVLAYKRMGRGGRIFCMIVDGEPDASDLPGRASEECLCPALRFTTDADGQPTDERTEPIAADARPGKDGKPNAKLKLIAGMLDVGFDALKQREQHRKMQRMTAITALAVVVMAVTIVLAIAALVSRHRAVIAQHEALVAQQAAQRRQKQAEGLVNFMLGDLNDKLAQVQRLDIMQAVDDKAMAYFESLPTADVTDEALAQRAKALEKIGVVRMDQGHLPAALEAFRASTQLSSKLAASAVADGARKVAYARTLSYIGFTYWDQGNLAEAQRNFQAAKEVLQRAQTGAHDNLSLEFELAIDINNLGHVHEARGDVGSAASAYRNMRTLLQGMVAAQSDNPKWQNYLGNAWDDLGKVELEQGHMARAVADYRTDQQIRAAVAASAPANHDEQEDLMVSNAILGRTLALCGEIKAALRYTRSAVAIGKTLVTFEPADNDDREDVALYSSQLGGLLRQVGKLDAAAVANGEAIAIFANLAAKDPTNTIWQREYAQARLELARLQLQQGSAVTARASAEAALQSLDRLRKQHESNPSLTLLTAQANLVLGEIAAKQGATVTARNAWVQARTFATGKSINNDPNALSVAASASLLLDEKDAALPLLTKLAAMGYHTPDLVALLASKHLAYVVDPGAARRIAAASQAPIKPESNP